MTTTFREILGKPSAAIRAMCDGLEEQSQRRGFRIDMQTFGFSSNKVCFGCAATCAAQKTTGRTLKWDTIAGVTTRADALGVDAHDLETFEIAIDNLRRGSGCLQPLLDYFGVCNAMIIPAPDLPHLSNYTWPDGLPAYRAFADQLEENGL